VNSSYHSARAALLVLLAIGAIACSTDAGGENGGAAAAGGGGRPPVSITLSATDVATVTPTTIEDGVALTGDLNPIETVDIHARIEGDLVGVFVREGQQVSTGQLLARFEASEQESARKSADADRVAAESDLANARWVLDQNGQLLKAGAIAQQVFKNSEQAVAAAQARLAAAEARVRAMGNQERDTRVVSPTTGIVSKRLVEGGEHVAQGAPLFTVVRNNVLELAASVPARRSMGLRVGQVVHFVADGRQFDGKVARLSPTIDPATRALTVYVQVPNPGGLLRGGTFATGRVVNQTLTGALVVPTAALRQAAEDGKPFVYRIEGTTLNVAPVTIGVVDERQGLVQVSNGLTAGDRVIVGNVGTLGRGMQVTVLGAEQSDKPK
jgi:RND family efflux transporter MFP subunit